jgi:hypothetical protein
MNLLIIGYCHLDDGFLYASKALEKMGYKIHFFPYLSHMMDKIENRDDILLNIIKKESIDICLWWCNNVTIETYDKVINNSLIVLNNELLENNLSIDKEVLAETSIEGKTTKKNIINYFFSWDPVLYDYKKYDNCYDIWNPIVENKKNIYALMTHVFSCFEREIEYFKSYNNISYAYPGFDKNISFYDYDSNYECDISIVCTNIYNNNNEFPSDATNINRYEIIDKLYKNRHKINFHIYGTENLKAKYPDCYKGFIKYQKCNKVFSSSKINLSIHPIVSELNKDNSTKEYFSERLPQILGSKGLLVTNSKLSNNLVENEDYIYIDRNMDWIKKLLDIIKNNDKYNIIRENGYKKGIEYYTWNNFAYKIDYITKLLSE